MTQPQSIPEASCQKIDTELARLYGEVSKIEARETSARDLLFRMAGYRPVSGRGGSYWKRTHGEMMADAQHLIASGDAYQLTYGKRPSEQLAAYNALGFEKAQLMLQILPLEKIFDAAPWSRFFLVTSSDGHIHSSMRCSTCRITTGFGWLPGLSGKTEADAVAEQGPFLCSVCFSSAPVEWRRDRSDVPDPAKAAEKAARAAAKAAKELTGSEQFRGYDGSLVTTVAGAKQALRDEVGLRDYCGRGPHTWHPASVVAADTAKAVLHQRQQLHGTGATREEIARIIASAEARERKNGARI